MKEYNIIACKQNCRRWITFEQLGAEKIANEFKENGFNVTIEAIKHNFEAWKNDYKSGFRDEANNYHLFSPCGCNNLRMCATELEKDNVHWQTTYKC